MTPTLLARRQARRTSAPRTRCARGIAARCSRLSPLRRRHGAPRGGAPGTRVHRSVLRSRRAHNRRRHVATRRAAAAGMWREASRTWFRRARTLSLGEALALELLDRKRNGAVEDFGGVSRGYHVTQQRLGTTELVVCLARDGELNPIALRREAARLTPAQASMFTSIDDRALLDAARHLVIEEHLATAALLRALMEIDTRRLYLGEGFASMFSYWTQGPSARRLRVSWSAGRISVKRNLLGNS